MAEILLQAIAHSYQARRGAPEPPARGGPPTAWALRDIELRWRDGGAYALLGPSGCGKTTLLGIISGLIHPTRGRVMCGGRDITALPTRERNIAQVFQFPVIYDTMTVHDNLAFPLRNRGLPTAEIERRVGRIAEILELTEVLPSRATRLSADQKQILALGRGLVREDVAAILFDEPLTVIDPHRKWLLRRKLKEIHKQFHHTMIYVTHDQTEALTFADEVVVMQHGRVLQCGTPEDLFRRPAHTYVGYFIGSPGMNVLPCRLERGDPAGARARIADRDIALPELAAGLPAGELELGIRPEHIAVLGDAAGDAPGDASDGLPVAVTAVEDHGRFRIVTGVLAGAHRIKIRSAGPAGPAAGAAGATIQVRFPPEHICLYRDSRIIAAGPRAEEPA
ncbi:MAG TPA: ABC transporter ATP-binding protein [Kofleriaceae bacterium]|nr:ABC transporter ATP-binding protein [Kofleriaceae bacterium]